MPHLARPSLRLIIGPAVVAAFAVLELRHAGAFAAVVGAWCVFTICVFTIGGWGKIQVTRTQRRLQSQRDRRSTRTR